MPRGLHQGKSGSASDDIYDKDDDDDDNGDYSAVRDWSRANESDLCAIDLGSIPGGGQLRAVWCASVAMA